MIIGGQAVLLYGEPRLTRDIDITLGTDTERLPDLVDLAKELSLKIIPEKFESFVQRTMVLPLLDEPSGIRVDFIFSFTPYEQQAISNARSVVINGVPISFASAEDVIVHKIFAGRPKDLEDVKNILLKNPETKRDYIEKWLVEFEKSLPEKQVLELFRKLVEE